MSTSDYLGIITQNEIQHLRQSAKAGVRHPLAAMALAPLEQVAINTAQAARGIARKDQNWLSGLKPRLLDTTDVSNASSALGEIRAYGALLESGMTVMPRPAVPGKKVVPEFEVNEWAGPVIVEVHSRQLDKAQAEALGEHHDELEWKHRAAVQKEVAAKSGQTVVTAGALEVIPLGAPDPNKPTDSVLTNAISRIASIKQDERQIDPQKPFLLWLDLQDPTVWGLPVSEEQLAPLYTENKNGEVGTGALWFALYGRKGDPMIETEGFTYRIRRMLHDGRFFQTMRGDGGSTCVSAVVYSLPRATVLMENPSPALPLPAGFRASFLKAPFFRLESSICEWELGLVRSRIEHEHRAVCAVASALSTFNPT